MTRPKSQPKQRFGNYVTTHGLTGTPEYSIWSGIRKRCNNPSDKIYPYYGGRGIEVCERWNDFANFLADMGPRPTPKHSVERRQNTIGYEPGNCYWATRTEQMRNTRYNNLLTHEGRTLCVTQWAEVTGIPPAVIYCRRRRGDDAERALRPLNTHRRAT